MSESKQHVPEARSTDARAYLAVMVANLRIALIADFVDEICELRDVVPIPRVPSHIPGLFALRGQAVPLLDLAGFFRLEAGEADDAPPRVAVVNVDGMRVGLICDRAAGFFEIGEEELAAPSVTSGEVRSYVSAEVTRDEGLVAILNLSKLIGAAKVTA